MRRPQDDLVIQEASWASCKTLQDKCRDTRQVQIVSATSEAVPDSNRLQPIWNSLSTKGLVFLWFFVHLRSWFTNFTITSVSTCPITIDHRCHHSPCPFHISHVAVQEPEDTAFAAQRKEILMKMALSKARFIFVRFAWPSPDPRMPENM